MSMQNDDILTFIEYKLVVIFRKVLFSR